MPISKGWWNNCLLFKPKLLTGRVLYLDLDVIIVRDLVKYFEGHDQLTLLANKYFLNGNFVTRLNTLMMCWNADDLCFRIISDTYLLNKELCDSDGYLKRDGTSDIDDQQVILDSKLQFRFFPSQGIKYFKFIKDEDYLSPDVDLIVCKGKNKRIIFNIIWCKNFGPRN